MAIWLKRSFAWERMPPHMMCSRFRALVAVALLPLFLGFAPAAAAANDTVVVGLTSRGATDWAIEAALKLGFFAQHGIDPQLIVIGSSAGVAQQLTGGSVDIGSVSTTQVVLAVVGGAPIEEIYKNVTTTPYTFFGRKGITSMSQLRGKTVMIGGPYDITRVFTDKILATYGFASDDANYTYAGAPATRYQALVAGAIDATLLLPPETYSALDAGYSQLDSVPKYFPRFPTSGFAARVPWATTNRAVLVRFLQSVTEGVRWLYNPANKARALQLIEEAANVTPDVAEKTYATYVLPGRLLPDDGAFAKEDFPQVMDALIRTKQIAAPPAVPVYDNSYIDAAQAAVRGKN
jgi:ABC-type nitrate/sulfonate/bicarbonate transport system substrate-binding protein